MQRTEPEVFLLATSPHARRLIRPVDATERIIIPALPLALDPQACQPPRGQIV
jgi:hypothetical protein